MIEEGEPPVQSIGGWDRSHLEDIQLLLKTVAAESAGKTPPARTNSKGKRGGRKWYYAASAASTERTGPVSKAAIVELVQQGALQPAAALVWRKGLEEWVTIDACAEIASLSPSVSSSAGSVTSVGVSPRPGSPLAEEYTQAQLEKFAVQKQLDDLATVEYNSMLARTRLPAAEADALEMARAKSPSTVRSGWPVAVGNTSNAETLQEKITADLAQLEQQLANVKAAEEHVAKDSRAEAADDQELVAAVVKIQAGVRGRAARRLVSLFQPLK